MIDITPLAVLIAVVSIYYTVLFIGSHWHRQAGANDSLPHVIVVVPAHNEELVIAATLDRLLQSDYCDFEVMVMDDGSTDRTAEICERYARRGVRLVRRPPSIAGQGKGAVLNHAFEIIRIASADRASEHVVVAVMDADGQLDKNAISAVAKYFSNPQVGGVQIGVRIANSGDGLLQRAQDMEFVGFSGFVQTARDWTGSVGLGGNGQFTRLSALERLGRAPWSDCLTEDLDLGLSLVEHGYTIRFCPDVFVAQQGVDRLRPLLRQRTRWVQGHYQCWRHVPRLIRTKDVPLITRIDLVLYLGMLVLVTAFAANAVIGIGDVLGLIHVRNGLLESFDGGPEQRLVTFGLSVAPPLSFVWTYQRRSATPLRWWQIPAAAFAFTMYTYIFVLCQFRAWYRLARGRNNWAKTQRVATAYSSPIIDVRDNQWSAPLPPPDPSTVLQSDDLWERELVGAP